MPSLAQLVPVSVMVPEVWPSPIAVGSAVTAPRTSKATPLPLTKPAARAGGRSRDSPAGGPRGDLLAATAAVAYAQAGVRPAIRCPHRIRSAGGRNDGERLSMADQPAAGFSPMPSRLGAAPTARFTRRSHASNDSRRPGDLNAARAACRVQAAFLFMQCRGS